ncbi:unnamed protein product [Linum trigynum]|uniref:Uncharacterized protein n=1 Tax=Linum trigynum TaxID=586398 RepID=A0AAV2F8M7_9ROSI
MSTFLLRHSSLYDDARGGHAFPSPPSFLSHYAAKEKSLYKIHHHDHEQGSSLYGYALLGFLETAPPSSHVGSVNVSYHQPLEKCQPQRYVDGDEYEKGGHAHEPPHHDPIGSQHQFCYSMSHKSLC